MRPLTAPAFNAQYAFRCTTAGTAATEPAWPANNNATVTTGGATFTNVTGQSTYGWSAAAGNLYCITPAGAGTTRFAVGDRAFLSSDHSETNSTANASYAPTSGAAYGVIEMISVNRAGSVPPVAADALSGATVLYTAASGALVIECNCSTYWQGMTFNLGGAGATLQLASNGHQSLYLKSCALVLSTSNTGAVITPGNPTQVTLDNTTVQFNNAGQSIRTGLADYRWIGTPSATLGTVPTNLFTPTNMCLVTCRGVDLSAITTTLFAGGLGSAYFTKLLLDSCRIASGAARLGTASYVNTTDEVELVTCFDGTNIISERHTPAGDITTNRSTTLVGGAQDDVGLFSHQLVSSSRVDPWNMTLDSFWMDVENTYTGNARTATVELISGVSLNNNDITLMLEYLGTSGSSLATFANSLASPLTATAALPTSTAAWNNTSIMTWNPSDLTNITLSGGNLTAATTASGGGVRTIGAVTTSKWYWEYTCTTWSASVSVGVANASATLSSVALSGSNACWVSGSGSTTLNGSNPGVSFGTITSGSVVCVALDLVNNTIWFRVGAAGNWNASGTANPATNTGGMSVAAFVSTGLFGLLCDTGQAGNSVTANFGASAFTGAAPSGFTSGIPGVAQHIQITFTPQQAGRVRGLVRLGKVSTTVYVNPQIIVT